MKFFRYINIIGACLILVPFLGFPTVIKQLFLVVLGIILIVLVNFFRKDFYSLSQSKEDISGTSFKDSHHKKIEKEDPITLHNDE